MPDQPSASSSATQPEPPRELEARTFLNARFRAAGYNVTADYQFHAPGLAVVLDAYDPTARVGYTYISHGDADVVSDIDASEELAFKALYDLRHAFILVLHDRDIDTLATLEHRLDDFLRQLHVLNR